MLWGEVAGGKCFEVVNVSEQDIGAGLSECDDELQRTY